MADPTIYKDRVKSLHEDGTDGPMVDRIAVEIEAFIVGQDRRGEEYELKETEKVTKAYVELVLLPVIVIHLNGTYAGVLRHPHLILR